MSEKYTRRIDLDDLAEQLHDASDYQADLETKNRTLNSYLENSYLERLTADLAEVRADYGDLVENRDAFARRVQELERELDEDERIQAWNEIAGHPFFESTYDTEDTLLGAMLAKLDAAMKVTQATVPRVITADELKEGDRHAVIWLHEDGNELVDIAQFFPGHNLPTQIQGNGGWIDKEMILAIVLLEDAPAEEPEPVKVGDTLTTIEELEALPERAVILDRESDIWQKRFQGKWRASGSLVSMAVGNLVRSYAPFTVLHLPEEAA